MAIGRDSNRFRRTEKPRTAILLRQANEDLQLRADDSVLIELAPLYDLRTGVPCSYQTNSNNNNNGYNENGDRNASNCNNNNNNNNAAGASNGTRGLTNNGVDLNALASGTANGSPSLNGNNGQRNNQNNQPVSRKQLYGKAKTDEERDKLEKFRKRISEQQSVPAQPLRCARDSRPAVHPPGGLDGERGDRPLERRPRSRRLRRQVDIAASGAVRRGGAQALWL